MLHYARRAALVLLVLGTMCSSQSEECVALGYPNNQSESCQLAARGVPLASRPAHYVQRSSDLIATLVFMAELGLRILRHEENEEACPITCNGDFSNPCVPVSL